MRIRFGRRQRDDSGDEFPGLSRRRRLLIALLAVATAVAVVLTLVAPPAGSRWQPPERCTDGRTTGCVGGKADVIVVAPPASAASAR